MGAMQKLGAWSLRAGLDSYGKRHYAKALRSWLLASRCGVQDGNLYIGELYERGEGVLPSPVDAAAWYRRAALKGHAEAQFRLGRLTLRGGRHYHLDRWRQGAAKDHPEFADFVTSAFFPEGEELAPDAPQAVDWLTRAAEAEHPVAAALLGVVLLEGKGVKQDFPAALHWLTQAALQKEPTAQFSLGEMHYRGLGVEVNYALGADWYEKAAENGHSGAQLAMAHLLSKGQGRPADPELSGQYMGQAAKAASLTPFMRRRSCI